jgi:hypothetical protein
VRPISRLLKTFVSTTGYIDAGGIVVAGVQTSQNGDKCFALDVCQKCYANRFPFSVSPREIDPEKSVAPMKIYKILYKK